ncbi:hypothetical protein T484DRAFT_1955840 [Baffinella frigidus]|nr:hypothetical protein T484DRAFT_1955840 [Cryptophyta sp. CCMP2293]
MRTGTFPTEARAGVSGEGEEGCERGFHDGRGRRKQSGVCATIAHTPDAWGGWWLGGGSHAVS